MDNQLLLNKREAAHALSVSVRTVDNLIGNKELTVRRVGRRVLIPRRALEDFARRDHLTSPSLANSGGAAFTSAETRKCEASL
jgi:excisionase family DNA binding protein